MSKVVVTWPDSQMLSEKKGFLENCELINSDKGIEIYGSSAYLVDEDWFNNFDNLPDADYTEDEYTNGLKINYEWPIVK